MRTVKIPDVLLTSLREAHERIKESRSQLQAAEATRVEIIDIVRRLYGDVSIDEVVGVCALNDSDAADQSDHGTQG